MSAAPAKTSDPKTSDPSMEEILASIRRIIADDDDKAPEPQAKFADTGSADREAVSDHKAQANDDEDVLDLSTADLTANPDTSLDVELPELSFQAAPDLDEPDVLEPAPAVPEPVVQANPVMEAPPPRAPEPERPRLAETPPPVRTTPPPPQPPASPPASMNEAILSHATTASVGQAFNLLSHTVMGQNAHTLEDVVREMLRPMLKAWLDDNLPPLVERLVAAEIQRVARGQR